MFLLNPYIYGNSFSSQYSMVFDGVDEYVRTAFPPNSGYPTGAISAVANFKSSSSKNYQVIVALDGSSASNRLYTVTLRGGDGTVQAYLWDSGGAVTALTSSSAGFNDGSWHKLVLTYDGTNGANSIKLYIDNTLEAQGTTTNGGLKGSPSPSPAYTFGSNFSTGTTFPFVGSINAPAFWDGTELTSGNVSDLFNNIVTPYDLNPTILPDIDNAVHNGTNWEVSDLMGNDDLISVNMEVGDRVLDAP